MIFEYSSSPRLTITSKESEDLFFFSANDLLWIKNIEGKFVLYDYLTKELNVEIDILTPTSYLTNIVLKSDEEVDTFLNLLIKGLNEYYEWWN